MNCMFCEASNASFAYTASTRLHTQHKVHRCAECACLFLCPPPTDDELAQAYADDYYGEGTSKFAAPIERAVQWFREARSRRVSRYLKPGDLILDIGCGNGQFLTQMALRGYSAHGVERPGKAAERTAQLPNVHLHLGGFPHVSLNEHRFQAITLWHVFEHLDDPKAAWDRIDQLLEAGGHLFLSLPNAASWQCRWFGAHWFHLDPPRHLFLPTAQGLVRELKRRGYRLRQVRHFSLEQNPFGFVQSLLNRWIQPRDDLYEQLKTSGSPLSLQKVAFALLAIPAVFLSLAEAAFRRGGTIELIAQKT